MALIDITADVKIHNVLLAFIRLGRKDFRATLLRCRKPARADQRTHKIQQQGPRGPWPRLAASTLARYARQGKRRNRRILARLPNSLLATTTPDRMRLESRVRRWSMAHQDGPTRVGHGAILPQRQFLWISDDLRKAVRREFVRALFRRWLGVP